MFLELKLTYCHIRTVWLEKICNFRFKVANFSTSTEVMKFIGIKGSDDSITIKQFSGTCKLFLFKSHTKSTKSNYPRVL